jgi:hypothetical protein
VGVESDALRDRRQGAAFDPMLPLGKLLRAVGSDERPTVPAMARAELAEAIGSGWQRDPATRKR